MTPLKEKAPVGAEASKNTLQADIKLCSGFGQFHSNELTAKIRKPYVSTTMAELIAMVKNPQSVPKANAQWAIWSTLHSRSFAEQEQNGQFWALWADFDQDPRPIKDIIAFWIEYATGCFALFYSSRSATAEKQKSHMVVVLPEPLSGSDWVLAQECLNDALDAAGFIPDRPTEGAAQLCYLPNRGDFYEYRILDNGQYFDPLTFFADQIAAKKSAIDVAKREAEDRRKAAEANRLAFNVSGSSSAIAAFNACHSVDDVLIKAGYAKRGNSYRHPQSESGSYSASVKNGRVYSLSQNDPLYTGTGAHDAFSAWVVLFFGGDQSAAARFVYQEMRRSA